MEKKLDIRFFCTSCRKNSKRIIFPFVLIVIFTIGVITIPKVFAQLQPLPSIEFFSENLNYSSGQAGAWRVRKSAKWTAKDKARITFDVDTIGKKRDSNTDVIIVTDISSSMTGYKLEKAKANTLELVHDLLVSGENKVSLISFNEVAEIEAEFTNDEERIIKKVNNFRFNGRSNYYEAFVKVNDILKNYEKSDTRDCVMLFLTGSFPSFGSPNESAYFNYLKNNYSYLSINAVQYGMGDDILEIVKSVSDNQYIVNEKTSENVLFDAVSATDSFKKFNLIDYVDTDNFYIGDVNSIKASQGMFSFDKANQIVDWSVNNLKSGAKLKLTIDVNLNASHSNKVGVFSTNKKQIVKSQIYDVSEDVESTETPILANSYKVSYDVNVPAGCKVSEVFSEENHFVFDEVSLTSKNPVCEGYKFKGWKILDTGANQIDAEHFIMPSKDFRLRAEWSKMAVVKRMNGTVYTAPEGILQVADRTATQKFWEFKDSITKVIFQEKLQRVFNATKEWDVSEAGNGTVMAYLVPNTSDTTTYTLYIQGDNGVVANKDSSYLFNEFFRLEAIEGLQYLDTTNTEDMSFMFGWDSELASLDVSNFETAKVKNMQNMFRDLGALETLDVRNFNTSNVTDMRWMFGGTSSLKSLDLSSFDTSKVTDMYAMFAGTGVTSLDLSHFVTDNVTTMYSMFSNANSLVTLKLDKFNTAKVTNMQAMFNNCYKLTSLNLTKFDVGKVTTMKQMFYNCWELSSLDLSSFRTGNVTNMELMFYSCSKLTSVNVSNFDTVAVTTMKGMFQVCSSLTKLDLSNFRTGNVTNMEFMFSGANSLVSLNVSSFDTAKVTTMKGMFRWCSALTSLSLNNFQTPNVTDMSFMFYDCGKIPSFNLSTFNTTKVTTMESMFDGCWIATTIDVSSFVTTSATNMKYMFKDCRVVTSLNLTKFNTEKVTTLCGMFMSAQKLASFSLSSFNTANVTDMSYLFYDCGGITSLNLTNFDTSKVTTMKAMFRACWYLTSVTHNFNTANVTTMEEMFMGCQRLKTLNVSGFNTAKVTDMTNMFWDCTALTNMSFTNFNTSKVQKINGMFHNCWNINATITIRNSATTYDSDTFYRVAIYSTKLTINYISATSSLVNSMVASKSSDAHVVKGSLVT